jgi:hypothetical protein
LYSDEQLYAKQGSYLTNPPVYKVVPSAIIAPWRTKRLPLLEAGSSLPALLLG